MRVRSVLCTSRHDSSPHSWLRRKRYGHRTRFIANTGRSPLDLQVSTGPLYGLVFPLTLGTQHERGQGCNSHCQITYFSEHCISICNHSDPLMLIQE